MFKILAVDDEKKYRDLISLFLESEGMEVVCASNGQEALDALRVHQIDLVLLDVMLPDMSGFDVCKEIRKTSEIPVLFLTAIDDEDYHIIGYRSGGDDYIEKPFKSSVLALKINRILYRTSREKEPHNVIELAGICLDMDAFLCTVNGKQIDLTKKEMLLLFELIRHRGRVLTRDYLIDKLWGYDYDGESRVVDVLITKLRKKMGNKAGLIKTVINVGYKWEENG